jgi:hypothetical protein
MPVGPRHADDPGVIPGADLPTLTPERARSLLSDAQAGARLREKQAAARNRRTHRTVRTAEPVADPYAGAHFRYVRAENGTVTMLARGETWRGETGWDPLVKFVPDDNDVLGGYTAFPCQALRDIAGEHADLVAWRHMTAWDKKGSPAEP